MQIKLHGADYERLRNFTAQWNKRHTIPATRAVSYISDGHSVHARITNLQYWFQRPVFAQADGKGACVIPTSYTVSEPTVNIRQTKTKLTVNDMTVQNDDYETIALPVPEDQLQPIARCYRVDLINALRFVLPAMKNDPNDSRIYGIRIHTDGTDTLLLQATDTHRLHQKRIPAIRTNTDTELVIDTTPDLIILLEQLNGTVVSLGTYDETVYLVTERNELICWQHTLAFPATERLIPDRANSSAILRVAAHALRHACQSLGKVPRAQHLKTYFDVEPDTNQLTLTCAETKATRTVSLYNAPPTQPIRFAIDRKFILELLSNVPSHATIELGIHPRDKFALTDWRIVGNETVYALISGMVL